MSEIGREITISETLFVPIIDPLPIISPTTKNPPIFTPMNVASSTVSISFYSTCRIPMQLHSPIIQSFSLPSVSNSTACLIVTVFHAPFPKAAINPEIPEGN